MEIDCVASGDFDAEGTCSAPEVGTVGIGGHLDPPMATLLAQKEAASVAGAGHNEREGQAPHFGLHVEFCGGRSQFGTLPVLFLGRFSGLAEMLEHAIPTLGAFRRGQLARTLGAAFVKAATRRGRMA